MSSFSIIEKYNLLDRKYKVVFISTLLIGLVAHGMALFNVFSFHDNAYSFFSRGAGLSCGRWLITVISQIETHLFGLSEYSAPLINGIISLVFISVSACLFVWLLEIRRLRYGILVGGLLVAFPTIASLFGYMFTADIYMLSLTMGILGAILICKRNDWYFVLIGAFLLVGSIAIYQAFLPIILTVFLLYLINIISGNEINSKDFYLLVGKIIICVITVILIYFIILKCFLFLFKYELATYKGADAISLSVIDYITRIPKAYKYFFSPSEVSGIFFTYGTIRYVYPILLVLTLLNSIWLMVEVSKKNVKNGVILGLLLLLIPLCVNFMYIMCPENIITTLLQMYGIAIIFIFNIYLLEKLYGNKAFAFQIIRRFNEICLFFLLISYIRIDNFCYLKATFIQQETISYYNTLVSRIKNVDGYNDSMPVVFWGKNNLRDQTLSKIQQFEDIKVPPYIGLEECINEYSNKQFMRQWCGFSPETVEYTDTLRYQKIFESLPEYPVHGSIISINDTLYVKLGK